MTCQGGNHTQQSNYFKVVRTPCVLNAMSRTIVVSLFLHKLFLFSTHVIESSKDDG